MRKLLSFEFQNRRRYRLALYVALLIINALSIALDIYGRTYSDSPLQLIDIRTLVTILHLGTFVVMAYVIIKSMQDDLYAARGYYSQSLPVSGMQRIWAKTIYATTAFLALLALDWFSTTLFQILLEGNSASFDYYLALWKQTTADIPAYLIGIVMQVFFVISVIFFALTVQRAFFSGRSRLTGRYRKWMDIRWSLIAIAILLAVFLCIIYLPNTIKPFLNLRTFTIGWVGDEMFSSVFFLFTLLSLWSVQVGEFQMISSGALSPSPTIIPAFATGISLLPFAIMLTVAICLTCVAGALLEHRIDY